MTIHSSPVTVPTETIHASSAIPKKPVWKKTVIFLGWVTVAILFSIAYTQTPLYEGNQNSKFLHGIARAGRGYLQNDWLANTVDPLPVFSALVSVTARISESLFYYYYGVLFGIYIFSLYGIADTIFRLRQSWAKTLLFLGVFFAAHSAWLIEMQKQHGLDMTFLHFGVAGQYLLGLEFQNSSFGVLLLLSIYLFLKNRNVWAILAIGVAATFHPAYLFSAALMIIAYAGILFYKSLPGIADRNRPNISEILQAARKPFFLGLLALILVLPVVIHNQLYLRATSAEISARATDILVNYRIPHHSLPKVWFDSFAVIQIGMMLVGVLLARKSRLFWIMASLSAGGLLLTIIQIITQSNDLAYLAPWRVSVLLVPLSLSLILAWVVSVILDLFPGPRLLKTALAASIVVYLVYMSVVTGLEHSQIYRTSAHERKFFDMFSYIHQTLQPDEVFLVPPMDGRFTEFRLLSGAPTFVNWKSHPYKDTEILEWYGRVQRAEAFYATDYSGACQPLAELAQDYGITHVVFQEKVAQLNCDFVEEVYRAENYSIYHITGQP